jgi:hypothetical protein
MTSRHMGTNLGKSVSDMPTIQPSERRGTENHPGSFAVPKRPEAFEPPGQRWLANRLSSVDLRCPAEAPAKCRRRHGRRLFAVRPVQRCQLATGQPPRQAELPR